MKDDKIFYSDQEESGKLSTGFDNQSLDIDNESEGEVIIVDESPADDEELDTGEAPVITIERLDKNEPAQDLDPKGRKPHRLWPWISGSVVVTGLLFIIFFLAYRYYRTYINIGIEVSCTSEQNITKLGKKSEKKIAPEVIMTSDSVLDVAMNFYELRGLKAEISFVEPDTTDTDVFMYSRCADQTSYSPKTNHYLGSLVAKGKELESNNRRLGYCAMANGNVVVGIARDEEVRDYCIEQGGNFFRQFILVSNYQIPSKFHLHGKVERRALGRYIDPQNVEHLMYVETLHKETLYDFADALREYGFIDAIYITGGAQHSYYRTLDGVRHQIGADYESTAHIHGKRTTVPWMVFRKK